MAPIATVTETQAFATTAAVATISTPIYATADGSTVVNAVPAQSTVVAGTYTNVTLSDTDGTVSYTGFSSTACPAGTAATQQGSSTCYVSSSPGSTAQFGFEGVAVYIYGIVGPSYGVFSVTIDEQVYSNLSGYYESVETDVVIFSQDSLPDGTHTVVIENVQASSAGGADLAVQVIIATSSSSSGIAPVPAVVAASTVVAPAAGTVIVSQANGTPQTTTIIAAPIQTQVATATVQYVTTTNAFGQTATVAVSSPASTSSNSNTGAIIGGVIGAVLFLVILSFVFGYKKPAAASAPAATPAQAQTLANNG